MQIYAENHATGKLQLNISVCLTHGLHSPPQQVGDIHIRF